MSLFKRFLHTRSQEPHFVTTAEMVVCIEKILKDAEQEIIIVSPCIKMSKRILSIMNDKIHNNVDIKIVYRENFVADKLNITTFKRENLHAKCFFSDKAVLIGSMNLYDYSQIKTGVQAIQIFEKQLWSIMFRIVNRFQ